jgi:hypothetical protein
MTKPTDPREEAERLIASILGSASVAADGLRGFATGSAECCVCPVCKAIAAARDPNPEFAERLASGAADLASGLAGVLRAFSRAAQSAPTGFGGGSAEDDPWRAATRGTTDSAPGAAEPAAPPTPPPPTAPPATPPKPMAKKSVRPKAPPPEEPPEPAGGES